MSNLLENLAVEELLSMSKEDIEKINGPFSNDLCENLRQASAGDTIAEEELDEFVNIIAKNNPGLNRSKFKNYFMQCSNVIPKKASGTNWAIGIGVIAASVGLYYLAKRN